jgi:hypothetical protein
MGSFNLAIEVLLGINCQGFVMADLLLLKRTSFLLPLLVFLRLFGHNRLPQVGIPLILLLLDHLRFHLLTMVFLHEPLKYDPKIDMLQIFRINGRLHDQKLDLSD